MKVFTLIGLLIVAVSSTPLEETVAKFQAFKLEHGKTYESQAEEAERFAIFSEKLREIERHNALYEQGRVTYTKGINQFSDWTREEFEAYLTLQPEPRRLNTTQYVKTGVAVPSAIDWRAEGYVTGVKNQGECGSGWAFAVIGSLEGAYFKRWGKLVSLSEQQLIDCTTDINYGCKSGFLGATFPYIQQNGSQAESSYPYTGVVGSCQYNASQVVTKVSKVVGLVMEDEPSLLEAVGSVGPVAVPIDARYMDDYSDGVFSDSRCSTSPNHRFLVVGYGVENDIEYWLAKNSWGETWGDAGYIKIRRGHNECGIAEDDVYPIID